MPCPWLWKEVPNEHTFSWLNIIRIDGFWLNKEHPGRLWSFLSCMRSVRFALPSVDGSVLLGFGLNIAEVILECWPDSVTRWAECWNHLCLYCLESDSFASTVPALAAGLSVIWQDAGFQVLIATQTDWILFDLEGLSEGKLVSSPCTFS